MGWTKHKVCLLLSRRRFAACDDGSVVVGVEIFTDIPMPWFLFIFYVYIDSIHEG